ncbi:hypothetical protein EXIGLDRAFT_206537 [Exidia glandulosa HHB12029]|uniref:Uncharacterized protein n=1 Tax=Exidia glandulosa HHB12029 TaxID=1314781 RepID=A0A165MWE0_EXIGL|nr:hypothetical protein EXIGLDRAFT_206537 [Exidia glandulosa HHB12029]
MNRRIIPHWTSLFPRALYLGDTRWRQAVDCDDAAVRRSTVRLDYHPRHRHTTSQHLQSPVLQSHWRCAALFTVPLTCSAGVCFWTCYSGMQRIHTYLPPCPRPHAVPLPWPHESRYSQVTIHVPSSIVHSNRDTSFRFVAFLRSSSPTRPSPHRRPSSCPRGSSPSSAASATPTTQSTARRTYLPTWGTETSPPPPSPPPRRATAGRSAYLQN